MQLDGIPEGVGNEETSDLLLKHGREIEIPGIGGKPIIIGGKIRDPLLNNKLHIAFVGIDGKEVISKVKIARKIWFAETE